MLGSAEEGDRQRGACSSYINRVCPVRGMDTRRPCGEWSLWSPVTGLALVPPGGCGLDASHSLFFWETLSAPSLLPLDGQGLCWRTTMTTRTSSEEKEQRTPNQTMRRHCFFPFWPPGPGVGLNEKEAWANNWRREG